MTVFIRGIHEDDAVRRRHSYVRDVDLFRQLPLSPFAYWASPAVLALFSEGLHLESEDRSVRIGLTTHDDVRWLRLSWESPDGDLRPLAKGGRFGRYFSDLELGVRWRDDGRELVVSKRERSRLGELTENNSRLWNREYYGLPGLTWTRRSQAGFSIRVLPAGTCFGDKGPAIVSTSPVGTEGLLSLLALANSSAYRYLLSLQMAFGSFEVGVVRRTPLPDLSASSSLRLTDLARSAWSVMRGLGTAVEVSHAFVLPAVLQVDGDTFDDRVDGWAGRVAGTEAQLERVQAEIDELCFGLYGISDEDRRAITEGFGGSVASESSVGPPEDGSDDDEGGDVDLDPVGLAAGLVSWAVGVGVGRFDVRLATGERGWPVEPDPFDPLPVCSPGMLTGEDGLPAVPPLGYPVEVSPVLVTDAGDRLDVGGRVRSVFEVVFGEDADVWWSDVGGALGAKGGSVEAWLAKGFFDHHLKTYSRSRRKAPILWPLGTRSGSYLVWLYAHGVSADSLFRVLTDVVEPKVRVESQQLTLLRQEAGPEPTASQRKAIDVQERFVDELRELAQSIEELAPLWAPDLNDGVVVVLAPLWRLFAHHRAWSKELKRHWDKLSAGDYDWAQLAMHLWPERVVPKCATDRSLAIAHGLEGVFWVQDDTSTDKWHARVHPTIPVDQLIAERTNPATTAALQRQT